MALGLSSLLTKGEVAGLLKVDPRTIEAWVARGLLQPLRIGPRLLRFELQEIERFVASCQPHAGVERAAP